MIIRVLLAWTALTALENGMVREAARLAVNPGFPDRWVRMVAFSQLGWNDSLRLLLNPPQTRAETLFLADALIASSTPSDAIPLIRPFLTDSTLYLWAMDRLTQVFLQEKRPWEALVFLPSLPYRRRLLYIPKILEEAETQGDSDLVFAILGALEHPVPPAALFWWGIFDPSKQETLWDSLLITYPESPWAQKAYSLYQPSRRAAVSMLLAKGHYQEVLRRTYSIQEPWEVEARFLAYYKRHRYRSALSLYQRYSHTFQELPEERIFQALIAAFYANSHAYPNILQNLLTHAQPQTRDQAAHLTAHFLWEHPRYLSSIEPLALRYKEGSLAFQLGLVYLTRADTLSAQQWFERALRWANTDFDRAQAAFWLDRLGQSTPVTSPVWLSYYHWVRQPNNPLSLSHSIGPSGDIRERWLWAARLGEPWLLDPDTLPPWTWRALAAEARRWGRISLALSWATRYAYATGDWETVIPLLFPRPYQPVVCSLSRHYRIDPALIWAIMREESRFASDAISPAGAVGLMQLMPSTARRTYQNLRQTSPPDTLDLTDPILNISLGIAHLRELLSELPHLWSVLAAYNAGKHHAQRWLKIPTTDPLLWVEWIGFRETRNYVRRVYRSYLVYQSIETSQPACPTDL